MTTRLSAMLIKQFLDGDDTVKVVGEAYSVDMALKQIPTLQPDIPDIILRFN